MSDIEAYHELCGYTLTLGDPAFIHQHVVDAFAAQNATEQTKPIKLTFALVGLYLHLDCHFNGREVQRAHQYLAREKRTWPSFALPTNRGSITATQVLQQPADSERVQAIDSWCESVWREFRKSDPQTPKSLQTLCAELPTRCR